MFLKWLSLTEGLNLKFKNIFFMILLEWSIVYIYSSVLLYEQYNFPERKLVSVLLYNHQFKPHIWSNFP